MTFDFMPSAPSSRRARALVIALVAVTACTIDKDLATATDTTDPSTSTTDATPATDTVAEPTTQGTTTLEPTTLGPTTDEPPDSTSSTTAPTDPSSECACIDTETLGPWSYDCPQGPCEAVRAECLPDDNMQGSGGACEDWGIFTVDEAKLDCVLDQLIAGDVGYIEYSFTPDQGFSEDGGFIAVAPGREGLMRTWEWADLGGYWSAAGVVPLKDASYFEGCKAEPDLQERFSCMTAWSTQEPEAQCDGPDSGSRF